MIETSENGTVCKLHYIDRVFVCGSVSTWEQPSKHSVELSFETSLSIKVFYLHLEDTGAPMRPSNKLSITF